MVSKTTKTVIIVLILFLALFFISKGETILKADIYTNNKIVSTQSFTTIQGAGFLQSLAGTDKLDFIMQSTYNPTDKDKVELRATVQNPFKQSALLQSLNIYQNNQLIKIEQPSPSGFHANEKREIRTSRLDLKGTETIKNRIKLEFIFNLNGNEQKQEIQFEYITLNQCKNDGACTSSLRCDLGNRAGFSATTDITYCARPCLEHKNCPQGQLCKKGMCGY
tara:strand:- start:2563 stop:3228 length:666 start_codon:yes stop_codon:yes gene_type:complete